MQNLEKICHWSALIGQLGWLKNSRSHLKLILCCSLPNVIPHIKFHLNWMKNKDFQIFENLALEFFFQNLPKLNYRSKNMVHGAWSHWIRNCLNYWSVNINISPIYFTKWLNFPKLLQAKIGNLVSPAWVKNRR